MLIFIMFAYNRIAVLIGALEKVSDCVSDVTRITRVTLKFIHNALLVNNGSFASGIVNSWASFLLVKTGWMGWLILRDKSLSCL